MLQPNNNKIIETTNHTRPARSRVLPDAPVGQRFIKNITAQIKRHITRFPRFYHRLFRLLPNLVNLKKDNGVAVLSRLKFVHAWL